MSRYAEAVASVARAIERSEGGVGVVIYPPGELQAIVEAVLACVDQARVAAVDGALLDGGVGVVLASGGVSDALLDHLNGRRDSIGNRGLLLVLFCTVPEQRRLRARAGDVHSALQFTRVVDLVPDPAVDLDDAAAALRAAYQARFGLLDLRGLIRDAREDVAWTVEAVYQDLRARGGPVLIDPERALAPQMAPLLDRPVVLLGDPGAGKTFFLRWCALQVGGALFGVERSLPILVSAAALATEGGPLLRRILNHLGYLAPAAAHGFVRAAEQGRLLLLVDGLDEVPGRAQENLARNLGRLRDELGCPLIVTSRVAGYDDARVPDAQTLTVQPFNDAEVRAFLVAWCGLYAVQARGPEKRGEGEAEGSSLAAQVLSQSALRTLAGNPLLLTVLAVVHRTGVRLPDHRIELYQHASLVLVERWNQVRSLSGAVAAPPLTMADAVRILGPLALSLVETDVRAAFELDTLRAHVGAAIEDGRLRGVADADQAVALFEQTIGLIAEVAPGFFRFAHLTFAEYFAAREMVRTGRLEELLADPEAVFADRWHEPVRLALAELGLVRLDDARLEAAVDALVVAAQHKLGRPTQRVPRLLSGVLLDDPGLSWATRARILDELIPKWWFDRARDVTEWDRATHDVLVLCRRDPRWREAVVGRLTRCPPDVTAHPDVELLPFWILDLDLPLAALQPAEAEPLARTLLERLLRRGDMLPWEMSVWRLDALLARCAAEPGAISRSDVDRVASRLRAMRRDGLRDPLNRGMQRSWELVIDAVLRELERVPGSATTDDTDSEVRGSSRQDEP